MKATPLAAFAALFVAALCAFAPGVASAQRESVYTVSGVRVDETAANGAAAQQAGFVAAQRVGFERLVRRITLPAELSRVGTPELPAADLERLVLSTDVQDERRSGTRYIGVLSLRFDQAGVRAALQARNLTVVETRTTPTLVVPVAVEGTNPEQAAAWRAAWEQGGFGEELAPLVAAPSNIGGAPSWDSAAGAAQSAAAASALYATLRVQGQTATAALVEVGPNNTRRDRGEVTAGVGGSDANALRAAMASLADQASQRVQTDWKSRLGVQTGPSSRVSAQALYSDERQWEQIKSALEAAAATLISEIRIEAVGREGALVSFSYRGDSQGLAAELRRRGVSIQESAAGPVLRVQR